MTADDLRHVIAFACVLLIASKERAFAAYKDVNIMFMYIMYKNICT
jgi:hypothetical protein